MGAGASANEEKAENVERRKKIYDKVAGEEELNVAELVRRNSQARDMQTVDLLNKSLKDFFFMEEEDTNSDRMQLLMGAMLSESFQKDDFLLKEGEAGNKMYVLAKGSVQITIKQHKIRQVEPGGIIGELALMYDAPRSATAQCLENCEFWSLEREIFRQIQSLAASASQLQRSKWVHSIQPLATSGIGIERDYAIEISRLVRTMQPHKYLRGEALLSKDVSTNKCILVEKGEVVISLPPEFALRSMEEIDKILGVFRPVTYADRRVSTKGMSKMQLDAFIAKNPDMSGEGKPSEVAGVLPGVYSVYEGCFIGMGPLFAKAGKTDIVQWRWTTQQVNGKNVGGAISPVTATAKGDVLASYFTVDTFERLFGPATDVFTPGATRAGGNGKARILQDYGQFDIQDFKQKAFIGNQFKTLSILGKGSFGVVTLAEYTDPITKEKACYACKALNKATIIETGQLRHVQDERHLLSVMNSNFIIRLFGTYQTQDQLIMVIEALNCGDLWGVLYENKTFLKAGGLPPKLTRFYSSCIVLALTHIHGKGVAYRDLKPENIMLDSNGYIRIIDFGFAKRIPFVKTEANGDSKLHIKSYTLCGTPEYLSPEFIFNAGHDQSADLWAFGVMLYEMYMGVTPFAPRQAGNMTDLFTRIATVKRAGLVLPEAINMKDDNPPHAKDLIEKLLKAEPSERIGVQEGNTGAILEHGFFDGQIDIAEIRTRRFPAPFVSPIIKGDENLANLPSVKPYTGDPTHFESFDH